LCGGRVFLFWREAAIPVGAIAGGHPLSGEKFEFLFSGGDLFIVERGVDADFLGDWTFSKMNALGRQFPLLNICWANNEPIFI
jgi:hypothetical protein